MTTLYEILGVTPAATPAEIKAAHRQKVQEHHPDKGGDPDQFRKIQQAYEVLSDPERRARYDATGSTEEDREEEEIQATMIKIVNTIMSSAIKQSRMDLSRTCVKTEALAALAAKDQEFAQEANDRRTQLARANELKKRFKAKGEKDLIGSLLDQQIRNLEKELTRYERINKIHTRLREMFDTYDYEHTPPDPNEFLNPQTRFRSTWTTPTSF